MLLEELLQEVVVHWQELHSQEIRDTLPLGEDDKWLQEAEWEGNQDKLLL